MMGAAHWLHMATGRGRHLAAYAAGELPDSRRALIEVLLTHCPACRSEVQAYRSVCAGLQGFEKAGLSPAEAAIFWPGVQHRLLGGPVPPARLARPSMREMFWDHPKLSLASAAAAVVLVLGVTLGQMGIWTSGPPIGSNGVEVLSIEGGEDASVMIFQVPGSSLKIIWVFENPSPS